MYGLNWPRLERSWRTVRARLREWCNWLNGDTAYAYHLAHCREHHPERPPPTRAEFYLGETERRWNGVRRCC